MHETSNGIRAEELLRAVDQAFKNGEIDGCLATKDYIEYLWTNSARFDLRVPQTKHLRETMLRATSQRSVAAIRIAPVRVADFGQYRPMIAEGNCPYSI